jgi:DNA-binding NtrC family response regulator
MDAADALISTDTHIRVGLWPHSVNVAPEELKRFSALTGKHRLVQWLALLPSAPIFNDWFASHVFHHFFDYLTTPVTADRLYAAMGHAYGMSILAERATAHLDSVFEDDQMVGTSLSMRQLFMAIRKVAVSDAPVLISGESGTGKELTARAIHERSRRAQGPFIAVDCGAIPPTLIHSELFGYEKGAFSGAAQRKAGRIEVADGGTLFLDEIGDLPLDLQGNLLRFLQESTIQRVGSTRPVTVDARIVAASHVDLEKAVKEGRFRQDLFYRLNVLRVHVPALREREGDVVILARYFLAHFLPESGKQVYGFTPQALNAMLRHHWQGNVRELINRVRRAIVMCDGLWITHQDLDIDESQPASHPVQLEVARDLAERHAIAQAIKMCRNNYSAAARMLGVSRVTLYRLLEKHRLAALTPPGDWPGP